MHLQRLSKSLHPALLSLAPTDAALSNALVGSRLTDMSPAQLPSANIAYAAKVEDRAEKRGSKQRRSLAELIGVGFQLIPWNGFDPQPLVDSEGRVFLVLVGQPRDERYCASVGHAYDFIKQQGAAAHFPAAFCKHRRSLFAAINVGLTFGKGQMHPTWLDSKDYTSLTERLLAHNDIARMAHFASTAFQVWAPRLYQYYVDYNTRLRLRFPDLKPPFPKSVFSCVAFNFGNVCCFKHRDVCNLPFGWCAVQSLGNFDPHLGEHLVHWDLKLVVEFPAGTLILLPSATIAHSNVPVQDGDERVSFTQFTASGLFRYIDHGFRTQGELAVEDPVEKAAVESEERRAADSVKWQDRKQEAEALRKKHGPVVSPALKTPKNFFGRPGPKLALSVPPRRRASLQDDEDNSSPDEDYNDSPSRCPPPPLFEARTFNASTWYKFLVKWDLDCTKYHNHESESAGHNQWLEDARIAKEAAVKMDLAYLARTRPPPVPLSTRDAHKLFKRVLGPEAVASLEAQLQTVVIEDDPPPPPTTSGPVVDAAIGVFKRTAGAELVFSRDERELFHFLRDTAASTASRHAT
ncbi:hypothetical protein B0H14DRAFT_3458046 [Mycena olivaceomarginata]|nr:hypothetical protein B0H14DRAFT_3458046 [Mycena olivaceomarginata]